MLDTLRSLFKDEYQFTITSALVGYLGNINSVISDVYIKDSDSKNAAIDAVCAILQELKQKQTES